MTALRALAAVAGVGILAAVAHVTIMATGGYADTNAAITIALACGVAIGAPVAGICFERGRWPLGLCALAALLAGELYGFGATASWYVAHLEAQAAPIHEAEAKHADAKALVAKLERDDRVQRSEAALRDTRTDATAKSTAPGCGQNCKATLAKAIDDATAAVGDARTSLEIEQRQARAALDHAPQPGSATPLADRLGVQPWALDLILAGLRSFACTVLAAVLLAFAAHGRREAKAQEAPPFELPRNVVALAPPKPKSLFNGDVDSFLLERVTHKEGSRVSWASLYISYCAWCDSTACTPVDAAAFGARLDMHRAELGLKVRTKGKDVFFVDLKLAS